jgi:serine/threonine protein phosphatase PrpC
MTSDPAAGPSSPCPSCGQPVWPGDNFCEACRAPLNREAAEENPGGDADGGPPPGPAGPAAGPPVAQAKPACPQCGSSEISPDGYCETCGRKMPSARDHAEIDLGHLAGVTDRGLHHYRNEDALAVAVADGPAGPVSIAVVCDGVSGSDRGDEASQVAVQAALSVLLPAAQSGQDAQASSLQAVQAAQVTVAGLSGPPESSMTDDSPSATFVSAVVSADDAAICWLGDSRAYWLDPDTSAAQQLTTDDSLATELVTAGVLTEEEAPTSPQAHVVTGWLGADVSSRSPHLLRFVPPGPGAVLLCSDGLWNYLPEAQALADRVMPQARDDPIGASRALVEFALTAGGHDNITVVIAPFPPSRAPAAGDDGGEDEPTQPASRRGDE